jgi:outer membrane protein OmpA-like peptidoglycan-associated protein
MIFKTLTFFLIIFNLTSYSQYDTLSVYFDFDKPAIKSTQKIKISSFLVRNEKQIEEIKILGYADFKGSVEYNINLSQNRADNIYNYLLSFGVSSKKIILCTGKGKLPSRDTEKDRYFKRRVDIIYKSKNNNQNKQQIEKAESKPQSNKLAESIEKAQKGDKLVLENMYFIGGRHYLLPTSDPAKQKLLILMKDNPKLKIEIQGHICCQAGGDGRDIDTGEDNLSVTRAKYIYDYLISKGINKDRLRYKGFGSDRLLEGTTIHNPRNRRVEIMIIDK